MSLCKRFFSLLFLIVAHIRFSQELIISDCPIAGAGNITVGGPLTLSEGSKYYYYGRYLLNGAKMFQHWVNYERSPRGIRFGSEVFCLVLHFQDDDSDADMVAEIVTNMTQDGLVDFFLAPYSSTLSSVTLSVTDPLGYIVLAAGAASESVFSQFEYGYAIQPPSKQEFDSILKALYYKEARRVVYMHENAAYPNESCKAIDDIVDLIASDMEVVDSYLLPFSPTYEDVEAVMDQVFDLGPVDIVVSCVYLTACIHVTELMIAKTVEPNAFIMSVCATMEPYVAVEGEDAQYLLSNVPWSTLMTYDDEISGWNTQDFVANYSNAFNSTPTHHAAGQFVMLEVLMTVIERAESIDSQDIAFELARVNLDSFYGPIEFSNTNMNKLDTAYVQLDETVELELVIPEIVATAAVLYPMVSWSQRDCIDQYGDASCECSDTCSDCSSGQAIPEVEECNIPTQQRRVKYSWPSTCKIDGKKPPDDTFISCGYIPVSSPLGVSMITLSTIIAAISLGCAVWILLNRKSKIILANQPNFLILFCFGCIVLSLDTITFVGRPTFSSCVARFSLLVYGFTLMFGTLLMLVYRVWRIFANAKLTKVRVREKDVLQSLLIMLGIDAVIMILVLTAFKPNIVEEDSDMSRDVSCNYPSSEIPFVVIYKVLQLLAGCYLSFKTKDVDKKYLQSNLIMIAVYNMSILWLCFIVASQLGLDQVSYSITSIFTILGSCVTGLAFFVVPKIYMHFNEPIEDPMNTRTTVAASSVSQRNRSRSGISTDNEESKMNFSQADFARLTAKAAELTSELKAVNEEMEVMNSLNAGLQTRFEAEFKAVTSRQSFIEFTKRYSVH